MPTACSSPYRCTTSGPRWNPLVGGAGMTASTVDMVGSPSGAGEVRCRELLAGGGLRRGGGGGHTQRPGGPGGQPPIPAAQQRSEEHTSELQSRPHLVC